jgi:hypothetical protein
MRIQTESVIAGRLVRIEHGENLEWAGTLCKIDDVRSEEDLALRASGFGLEQLRKEKERGSGEGPRSEKVTIRGPNVWR